MDFIGKLYRGGQRVTVPKFMFYVITSSASLYLLSEFYIAVPKYVERISPADISQTLLKFIVHFVIAILLSSALYAAKAIVDFVLIGRHFPRHYIYCRQALAIEQTPHLVFGHFSIRWSGQSGFIAHGISYKWSGSTLERHNGWSTVAIAPNLATVSLDEIFLVVNAQPPGSRDRESWITTYEKLRGKGAEGNAAYRGIYQKLSGEDHPPLWGYAELIAAPRLEIFARQRDDDRLRTETAKCIVNLVKKYREVNPAPAKYTETVGNAREAL